MSLRILRGDAWIPGVAGLNFGEAMNNSSLRKQLIITIIVMMLFVSSAIVWISIQAGTDAVNNLTQRVMLNVIEQNMVVG